MFLTEIERIVWSKNTRVIFQYPVLRNLSNSMFFLVQLARQDTGVQNRDDAAREIRSIFRTGLLAGQDLCSIYGSPADPVVSPVSSGGIIPALREANLESALALDSDMDVLRAVQDWHPLVSALLLSVSNLIGNWSQGPYNRIDDSYIFFLQSPFADFLLFFSDVCFLSFYFVFNYFIFILQEKDTERKERKDYFYIFMFFYIYV